MLSKRLSKRMSSAPKFVKNDNFEQVSAYINEICSDSSFLCANKELCGTSSTHFTNTEDVNKICTDIEKSKKCETDFDECLVSITNSFDEGNKVTSSFSNIIIPIPNAFDNNSNQIFLRLPSLSGAKSRLSSDVCNICNCVERFATSPGSSSNKGTGGETAPGQNLCLYDDKFESFYYPISIQNINMTLKQPPNITLGSYKVLNSNIIYSHSEDDLTVENLYELLLKNGIRENIAISFIIKTLYKNDANKNKELQLYFIRKKENNKGSTNGLFYQNMTFFYTLFVLFILFILLIIFKF